MINIQATPGRVIVCWFFSDAKVGSEEYFTMHDEVFSSEADAKKFCRKLKKNQEVYAIEKCKFISHPHAQPDGSMTTMTEVEKIGESNAKDINGI